MRRYATPVFRLASLHRACDTRQGHYIVLVNAGEAPCDPMGRGALAVHPPLPSTGLSIWWRTSGRRQLRRSTHGEAGSCGRNGGERAGRQRVAASTLGKIPGGAGLAVGAASSRRQRGLEQVTRRTKCRRGVGQAAQATAELDEAVSVRGAALVPDVGDARTHGERFTLLD